MRNDIEEAVMLIDVAIFRVNRLMKAVREQYGSVRDVVHAEVDLGHSLHELNRARSFVNRLLVNGKKPWDEDQ